MKIFLDNFNYAKLHFLISSILYEGSTLINLGFFIKEDFWYVVLILDFTDLNFGLLSFVHKILAQYKKSRKVDAIPSILQTNKNSIKFELLRCRPNLKTKLIRFYLQLWRIISLKTWISCNFERNRPFFERL